MNVRVLIGTPDVLEVERIADRLRDLRPAFGRVVEAFHARERQMFQNRGDRRWPPLKRSTLLLKRRRGLDRRVLVASGALRASLTSSTASGSVVKMTATRVEAGTSLPHARWARHRRPLIRVRPKDRKQFGQLIGRYATEGR